MWKLAFFALFLGGSISVAAGLKCYHCTWSQTDTKCLEDVTNAEQVDCTGFCVTSRGEQDGAVAKFERSCSSTAINEEKEVRGIKEVSQSCQADLCNDGVGTKADGSTAATGTTGSETAETGTTGSGTAETGTTGSGTAETGTTVSGTAETGTTGSETGTTTAATTGETTDDGDSGASSLTGMLSATFIGVTVALRQVL